MEMNARSNQQWWDELRRPIPIRKSAILAVAVAIPVQVGLILGASFIEIEQWVRLTVQAVSVVLTAAVALGIVVDVEPKVTPLADPRDNDGNLLMPFPEAFPPEPVEDLTDPEGDFEDEPLFEGEEGDDLDDLLFEEEDDLPELEEEDDLPELGEEPGVEEVADEDAEEAQDYDQLQAKGC